jgi:hypothetical protein
MRPHAPNNYCCGGISYNYPETNINGYLTPELAVIHSIAAEQGSGVTWLP